MDLDLYTWSIDVNSLLFSCTPYFWLCLHFLSVPKCIPHKSRWVKAENVFIYSCEGWSGLCNFKGYISGFILWTYFKCFYWLLPWVPRPLIFTSLFIVILYWWLICRHVDALSFFPFIGVTSQYIWSRMWQPHTCFVLLLLLTNTSSVPP